MIRVVIADDHPIVRAGIRALLDPEAEIDVVGEAQTGDAAAELARELLPDLVLMDLQFGVDARTSGVDATATIRALPEPAPYVLVLTNYDTDLDILGAVEAGASGYLLKDAPPSDLLAAIRAAAAGESALAPVIASRLMSRMRSSHVRLSARELQVLDLVAQGHANTEVAATLFVTEATVKSHLAHVFTKLGVTSRTSAVAVARSQGLLR
ncbi:response regulator [Demequina aurantiaca]|uniref:response regulator n=1 Tax=Demequina aurantiaca TaxID=676200 RepID=UPI000783DA30|nr:response regulator transcription factor [Demequina aurantiaca]